jgi:GNAT superfamily N-acetyltransferase
MTISIRPAVLADIPAMTRIRLAVVENALSDPARITHAMYVDYVEGRGRGWVAEADGTIVGFSCADGTDGSIWALFVDPAREGHGCGKALLREAVGWLFELGHAHVRLTTGAGTRADRFYAAQGWRRDGVDGKDAVFTLARP